MPRRFYSPDERADALATLNRFGQDIAATALKTGIPRRTLYTWRTEEWDQQRQRRHSQPPLPLKALPQFDSNMDALEHLRSRMLHIFDRIPVDLSHLPPYLQRDHEAARITLVGIILKLSDILGIPEPEYDEIEYVHEYVTEDGITQALPT